MTTKSNRSPWAFIGLLGCLVTLTGCPPPEPDYGVTCLIEGDSNITAHASGDPDKIMNYISSDGGMTWRKPASEGERMFPAGGVCPNRYTAYYSSQPTRATEAWQLRATADGKIRYRLTPNISIERSEDGGETWKREVDLTGEPLKPKTPTSEAKNYGPLDAMVHYPTGNVIVAMGHLGILLRTPDAQWQWIRVGNYYRGNLAALKTPVPRAVNLVPQPTPVPADKVLKGNSSQTSGIAFSSDGKTLVTTANGAVSLWRTEDWSPLATVGKLGKSPQDQGLALSPDGSIVATSDTNVVQLWSATDGTMLQQLQVTPQAPNSRVLTYVFSPDGTSLATGATDATIQLWSVADGTLLRTIKVEIDSTSPPSSPDGQVVINYVGGGGVTSLAFSPDGLLLAANTWSQRILVWRIADGRLLYSLDGGGHGELGNASLVFSTDNQMLLAGDTSLRVWRMTDGSLARMVMLPFPHGRAVDRAAFSSDRQMLATDSYGTIWLWRVADATLIRRFTIQPASGRIADLTFSPDNQMLAAVPEFGPARVWFLSQ